MKPIIGVMPLWDDEKESIWMLPGYMDGIHQAGGIPVILPSSVDETEIRRMSGLCDGFLFTGGHDVSPELYHEEPLRELISCCEVRDRMEAAYLHEAVSMNKPALGICRGIQLINAALGGKLYQDLPTQHPSDVEHHQSPPYDIPVHDVAIVKDSPLYQCLKTGKAFAAFLTIDDPLLQKEILDEEKNLAEKANALSSAKQVSYERKLPRNSRNTGTVQDSQGKLIKEKPFNDRILELGNAFSTHAEALNTCFGFKYKQYQKAYKDLGGGYAVWFPSIARKTLGEYVSTDSFSGWVNILSEDQKILLQVDNPIYSISDKSYDPNKRIIFARFEGDKRYRFIGIYGSEKRVKNGYEYTRLGTKFDTISFQIIEE